MASSGSHRIRWLLVAVVVLAGLLVAADRVTLVIAENVAASNIKNSQNLPSKPDVSVAGFPFLTQLASGSFDEVTMTANNVPVGRSGGLLEISSLHVTLHDVHESGNFATVHANTADATARISYADLGNTLGVAVKYAGRGRITATKSVTIAGQTVSAGVTTAPSVVNGALAFTGTAVNGGNQLAGVASAALQKVFRLSVPLNGIPFQVRVRTLRVDKGGLTLSLTGSDLTYTKP